MVGGDGECAHRVRTKTGTIPSPPTSCRVRMVPPRPIPGKDPKGGGSSQTGTATRLRGSVIHNFLTEYCKKQKTQWLAVDFASQYEPIGIKTGRGACGQMRFQCDAVFVR